MDGRASSGHAVPTDPVAQRDRGHLLIANDEAMVLRATAASLAAVGFDVSAASDAPDVIARLDERRPDALLLDIDMPGNHELELLQAFQARRDRIPVVLVTGHPRIETAVSAVRLGAVDYLIRPVEIDELARCLDRAVQRDRALRSIESMALLATELAHRLEALRHAIQHGAGPGPGAPGDPAEIDPFRNLHQDEVNKLSPRERDVLRQLALGNSPKRVAKTLELSTNTIRNHMKGIYLKLAVNSQIALLGRLAMRRP